MAKAKKARKALSMLLVVLMTMFTFMSYVPAKAASVLPEVKFVGLENIPAAVGEDQKLMLTSDYTGKVQYQIFYLQRDDSTKKVVEGWEKLNDWTPAADAKTPVEVKVPAGTITKAGNYSFAVRVKIADTEGTYHNDYGRYDSAYAFDYVFQDKATEGLKSAKLEKTENIVEGDKVVISGLKDGESYKLFTLNEDRTPRWDKDPVAESKTDKIEWTATAAGNYVLDLQLRDKDNKVTAIKLFNVKVAAKPAELKVESVSANNLKQVFVEFNGKVDEESATKVENYSILGKPFEDATLLEDGKTVVLTLKDDGTTTKFTNQKEYELNINNVADLTKASKISDSKYKFTALDVTIPTVKEVTALGTKAIKVAFSEPVQLSPANSTIAYKVDGKAISGSIKYVFPSEVIISTNVAVGEHKLSVSGVKDFYDYTVQEPGFSFTVAEDKEAPVIESAKTVDLKKAIITFNEPVKAVSNGYHTSKANLATKPIAISDNKVTLTFSNPMSLANTTIYVDGVEDYSGNKADRTIVITPELDTTRPEVKEVSVSKDGKDFTVKFSEEVNPEDAKKGTNYVIKNADDKAVTGGGLNSTGNPVVAISYASKTATFSLAQGLKAGSYTLTVSGIQDVATVKNTMMPYVYTFEIGDIGRPSISRAWYATENPYDGKVDEYVYVQFSKDMATDGNGNVQEVAKYNYSTDSGSTWLPMPTGTTVEMVSPDAVRLSLPRATELVIDKIRVTLVTDLAGNYIQNVKVAPDLVDIHGVANKLTTINIPTDGVTATATDTIEVVFDGKLANVDSSDFYLDKAGVKTELVLDTFNYNDDGQTEATFKITDEEKEVPEDVAGCTLKTVKQDDISSQDEFGAKVTANEVGVTVEDAINPTLKEIKVTGSSITVKFNEPVTVTDIPSVVTVKVDGKKQTVTSLEVDPNNNLKINVALGDLNDTALVEVNLLSANDTVKAVEDRSENAATSFQKYVVFGEAKTDEQAAVDTVTAKVTSPIAKVTGTAADTANPTPDEKIAAVKGYVETLVDATTNGLIVNVEEGTTANTYKVTITKGDAIGVKDNVAVTAFNFTLTDQAQATANVAEAKAALTTLAFDTTDNATATSPKILKPANHANGATYTLAVGATTPTGKTVTGIDPVAITRDTTDQFTFDITVTISSTVNEKTATDTKVFAVTVPTGIDPVTVVAK